MIFSENRCALFRIMLLLDHIRDAPAWVRLASVDRSKSSQEMLGRACCAVMSSFEIVATSVTSPARSPRSQQPFRPFRIGR
jgi:hypothetical protein